MRSTRRFSTSRPRPRLRRVGLLVALLVVGLGAWWALRAGSAPEAELQTEWPAIGPDQPVLARVAAPDSGVGAARLELVQGDRTVELARTDPPRPGPFGLGPEPVLAVVLQAEIGLDAQPWLEEGDAVLRLVARPWAGPLRSPEAVVVEQRMPVRRSPPALEVISRTTAVRAGGSGAAVLRVGPHTLHSGVETPEASFPSAPHPSGAAGLRAVLFAVPRDATEPATIRAFAVDDAGQRSDAVVPRTLIERQRPAGTIRLDDAFLRRVVPAIETRTPSLDGSGSLLDRYLTINRDLRQRNKERVAELAERTGDVLLVDGPFRQLPHSALLAAFGEQRSYLHEGRVVDRQVHLGMDLASTAGAAVPAANAGEVVFAGWLGIYGNTVVVDHGLGLMSLYGHLSTIGVQEGQQVTLGDALGTTGETGLAGGDHLHLEILVHGRSVDPLEWLDGGWLERSILRPLEEVP